MGQDDASRTALQRVTTWCALLLGVALAVPALPLLMTDKTFYIPWFWDPPLAILHDPVLRKIFEGWLLANSSALILAYGARRYERTHRPAAAGKSTARRRWSGLIVTLWIAFLYGIVTVSISQPWLWVVAARSGPVSQRIVVGAVILVFSVPALAVFPQAKRYGRRWTLIPLRSPDELGVDPFVLYLRPFTADETGYALARRPFPLDYIIPELGTHEEIIAATFRRFGRVVAVGRPGEELPFPGARRFYLPFEGWEPVVSNLICRARLVLLVAETGPGTLWELTEAVRLLAPERLLLLVQGDRAEYERFRRAARMVAADRLDELPPDKRGPLASFRLPDWPGPRLPQEAPANVPFLPGVVRFGAAWTPTFVDLDPTHAGASPVTLMALYEEASALFHELMQDLERTLRQDELPHARRHPA